MKETINIAADQGDRPTGGNYGWRKSMMSGNLERKDQQFTVANALNTSGDFHQQGPLIGLICLAFLFPEELPVTYTGADTFSAARNSSLVNRGLKKKKGKEAGHRQAKF